MNRILLCVLLVLLFAAVGESAPQSDSLSTKVVVAKLSVPTYPAVARQARITGAVTLDVIVRSDGGLESVSVVSGHPILIRAALDSAEQTKFECKDCSAPLTHYPMTYKFELGDAIYCTGINAVGNAEYETDQPQVTQSQGIVTIVDRPVATCDPSSTVEKVRSVKCLFLWRCGKRYPL